MPETVLNFKLEFSEKEIITPYAGLSLYGEMYRSLGLHHEVNQNLPAPRSGKGFAANDYVNPLVLMFIGGGKYIEDLRKIKLDQGLRKPCKLVIVPSGDATGDWLRRESTAKGDGVKKVADNLSFRVLRRAESSELTLDIDAMEIPAEKDDALYTYHGQKGYMPLLGFIPELDWCVHYEFRAGNVSPAERNYEFTCASLKLVTRSGKQIKRFRSDAAGYQAKLMNELNRGGVKYTITADLDCAVRQGITQIPADAWQPLKDSDGVNTGRKYAEFIHTMNESDHAFRVVVQRWVNPQLELFKETEQYCYHGIATNYLAEEKAGAEAIWWYNGRSNSENYNKELKGGFNLDYVPCNDFQANAVWFGLGLLAYNLVQASKLFLLPRSWVKKTIATIRWQLIQFAGKLIHRARTLILRVSGINRETYELYQRARQRCWELAQAVAG